MAINQKNPDGTVTSYTPTVKTVTLPITTEDVYNIFENRVEALQEKGVSLETIVREGVLSKSHPLLDDDVNINALRLDQTQLSYLNEITKNLAKNVLDKITTQPLAPVMTHSTETVGGDNLTLFSESVLENIQLIYGSWDRLENGLKLIFIATLGISADVREGVTIEILKMAIKNATNKSFTRIIFSRCLRDGLELYPDVVRLNDSKREILFG